MSNLSNRLCSLAIVLGSAAVGCSPLTMSSEVVATPDPGPTTPGLVSTSAFALEAPSTVVDGHPRSLATGYDVDHYDIELSLSHDTRSFSGRIVQHGTVGDAALDAVRLHAAPALDLYAMSVRLADGPAVGSGTIERDGDVVTLPLDGALAPGARFVVETVFSGIAGARDHYGLFVVESRHSELPSFYTQFESQGARLALPLVDEPFDKATTRVTLVGDERYTLLSNGDAGPCIVDETGFQRCTWTNADRISPYLITFVAAELETREATYTRADGAEIPLTVYAEPGQGETTGYSMYALERSMEIFEDLYGVTYPWARYGIVALPGFRYGGMENKGLTNIAASLVYFDDRVPVNRQRSIFGVTAHELAHEWFGNLVTMQWWDDVWLNEGFASYMTGLAMEAEFDVLRGQLGDLVGLRRWYMDVERGPFAHPIVYEDWTTTEQLFDAISYTKGRKVLEMLDAWLGRDTLLAGIRRYLTENAGGNAATARFFATIEAVANEERAAAGLAPVDLEPFVEAWVLRAGFPEVTVSVEWSEDAGDATIIVEQQSSRGAEDDTVWSFPLVIGLQGDGWSEEVEILVQAPRAAVAVPAPSEPTIVSPNRGGVALISTEIEGATIESLAHAAVHDDDPWGRGRALLDLTEAIDADLDAAPLAGDDDPRVILAADAIRAAITSGPPALALFAAQRATDTELDDALTDALCRALAADFDALVAAGASRDDRVATATLNVALGALGRVPTDARLAVLREHVDGGSDAVAAALSALLRADADGAIEAADAAMAAWSGTPVEHSIARAVAGTPDPRVLDVMRAWLDDPAIVHPLDHALPRIMVSGLVGANADLAYSDAGMAFVLDVLETQLDRPGTIMRSVQSMQSASERDAEDRARIVAMLDALAGLVDAHDGDDVEGQMAVIGALRDALVAPGDLDVGAPGDETAGDATTGDGANEDADDDGAEPASP